MMAAPGAATKPTTRWSRWSFSESPLMAVNALVVAGKTPAKYVETFKELRKNPQLTAREYGVPANVT